VDIFIRFEKAYLFGLMSMPNIILGAMKIDLFLQVYVYNLAFTVFNFSFCSFVDRCFKQALAGAHVLV